uniref:Uncharacterized protein n=1 Tax=viral metagenome TaxID=1070528 RepID=A0A6C0H9U5_9ZZZZ
MPPKSTQQTEQCSNATDEVHATVITEEAPKKTQQATHEEIMIAMEVANLMEQKNAAIMAQEATKKAREAAENAASEAMMSRIKAIRAKQEEANAEHKALNGHPNILVSELANVSSWDERDPIIEYTERAASNDLTKADKNKKSVEQWYLKIVNAHSEAIKKATGAEQYLEELRNDEKDVKLFLRGAEGAIRDLSHGRFPHTGIANGIRQFVKSVEVRVEAAQEATKKAQDAYTKAKQEVATYECKLNKATLDRTAAIEEYEAAKQAYERAEKIISLFSKPKF